MGKHDRQKGRSSLRKENKNNWPKKIRKTRQQTEDAINGPTNNDNDTSIAKVGPHLVQSKYMPNKIKHVTFLIILQFLSMKVKLAVAVFRNQTLDLALHFTYPVPLLL